MNDIFTKRGMKIGILFGGVVVLINLVVALVNNFIPFFVFITWISFVFVWVLLFSGGYSNAHAEGFTKENMTSNLKKSIGAGLWAALLIGLVGGIVAVIISILPKSVSYLGYSYTYNDFTVLGAIFAFFGSLLSGLLSSLFWFILAGIAYTYYPVSKLPSSVAKFFDKVKNFAVK